MSWVNNILTFWGISGYGLESAHAEMSDSKIEFRLSRSLVRFIYWSEWSEIPLIQAEILSIGKVLRQTLKLEIGPSR